jgi:hypothetical protein
MRVKSRLGLNLKINAAEISSENLRCRWRKPFCALRVQLASHDDDVEAEIA